MTLKEISTILEVLIPVSLVVFWVAVGGLIECTVSMSYMKGESITPANIYAYSSLNKFGCWFLFVLVSILSPVGLIIKIGSFFINQICNFTKYIFTVGR